MGRPVSLVLSIKTILMQGSRLIFHASVRRQPYRENRSDTAR